MENKNNFEDEIDFKNVAKTPLRWFGIVFPLFLVLIIAVGVYYVYNLQAMTLNSITPLPQDTTAIQTDIQMAKGMNVAGINLQQAAKPDDAKLAKGKELFLANCSSCHGNEGDGNGTAGQALNPKPRNFHAKDGWTNGRKFSDMYKTLQEGIMSRGMAAYEYMPPDDRIAVIHYIRTFQNDFPAVTPEELQQLDQQYNLTKGSNTAPQIPVKLASQKLEKEAESNMDKFKQVLSIVEQSSNPSAQLLNELGLEKERLLYTLVETDNWKTDRTKFVEAISSTIYNGGNESRLLSMTQEELGALQSYLASIY
jgi:mono/diheme cytochrome c family protein